MSLLKSVRKKLFTSKTKNNNNNNKKLNDDDTNKNEEIIQSTINITNEKKLSISTISLFEKLNNFPFILDTDPHDDWLDLNKSNDGVEDDGGDDGAFLAVVDKNPNEDDDDDDYSFQKTYLNITTETKSTCKIIKKFSNDCLDDYLVEIGILDESGFKFDEHIAEIELLRQSRHKNILALFDVYFFDMKLYVFTEYCANGTVGQLLTDLEKPLSQIQIHCVLTELLQGLVYLHDQLKICHYDLRADNLLITANGDIKISNFMVWAKNNSKLAKKNYFYIKSPHWMAPEIFKGRMNKEELDVNFKADIWSLGITCIEMANLYPPNSALSADSVILEISNLVAQPYVNLSMLWSNNFVDFIQQCLNIDYQTRPTAASLFSHAFITSHHANRKEMKNLFNERKSKLYNVVRETITDVEKNLKSFKQMHEQPELSIYDYFQELRNQIDLEAEKAKQYIETLQDEMIESLKFAETECFANLKKNSNDFHFPIKSNESETADEKQKANKLDEIEELNNQSLKEKTIRKIADWNMKIGGRNISDITLTESKNDALNTKRLLELNVDKLKSKLFLKKDYNFQMNNKLDEYPFGRLVVENNFLEKKQEKLAKAEKNTLFSDEIDLKNNTVSKKMIRMELKKRGTLR